MKSDLWISEEWILLMIQNTFFVNVLEQNLSYKIHPNISANTDFGIAAVLQEEYIVYPLKRELRALYSVAGFLGYHQDITPMGESTMKWPNVGSFYARGTRIDFFYYPNLRYTLTR